MPAKPVVAIAMLAGLLATMPAQAEPAASVTPLGVFFNPTDVKVAPGETDLLFIVERPGVIRVLRNEQLVTQPFLDIQQLVLGKPDAGAAEEQGLLSIAFPPDYQQSGRFYVYFTRNGGAIEISEFRRSATNRLRAAPATRRVLLTIPHPGSSAHDGGQLQFGPDGLLYIATGDGGDLTPPGEPARRLDNLLGKILRIDPTPSGALPYTIPPSNPYVGRGGRDEIFAYGLRNPWRFSFDGNRIAIADAGENTQEEVNFLTIPAARGVNFGWPQYEGRLIFDNTRPGPDPAKKPMFIYKHNSKNCVIIGGVVVHNPSLPALNSRYIYGDLCSGKIRSFIPNVATQKVEDDRPAEITLPALSGFGTGFNGRVYTVQISGQVSRLGPPQ